MMEIRRAKVKPRGPSKLIRLGERVGPIKLPGRVHDDSRYREKTQGIVVPGGQMSRVFPGGGRA